MVKTVQSSFSNISTLGINTNLEYLRIVFYQYLHFKHTQMRTNKMFVLHFIWQGIYVIL